MKKIICLAIIAVSTFALIQSCKKSDSGGTTTKPGDSFDRKGMLTNVSTNIIVPAYTSYQATTVSLDAAVSTFATTPNAANLTTAQNAFIAAYKSWQSVSTFEFGPAATVSLRVNSNTYPADISQINSNITSATYNTNLLSNLAAKGFPALDYLLFGTGADNTAILTACTTGANATYRKTYIGLLSAELKTNATTVLTAWTTGGYPATFTASTGTDAGSSTSLLYNQFVYDYEVLKNFEVGIPAGVQSMGTVYPQKVQAYYSKISLQLAVLHTQSLQNIYLGKSANAGDGLGFDDYLTSANAKFSDGTSLNTTIQTQFTTALAKLALLSDPLSTQISTNLTAVTTAYTELQKLTVMLKTDISSSLGILITYGDNDGD